MENINKNTNDIEIPIVIQIEQFRYSINKLIEESKLPIYIINPIIKDIFQNSNMLLQEYTKIELDKYQKSINEQKNENVDSISE